MHCPQEKLAKITRIDYLPYCSDNGVAAMIMSDNVGVATVVDKGKRSIRSCTDFILIRMRIYWLEIKHDLDENLLVRN